MTPESRLKDEVRAALDKLGVLYRRMHSGSVRVKRGFLYLGPEGTADFVVYRAQKPPEWIELKAEGQSTAKSRREQQEAFAGHVRALGHRYQVCKSVEDVMEFLKTGDAA